MLFLEGYLKQIAINRASAAVGGPAWSIRITNARGRTATFLARSWKLKPSTIFDLEGTGGLGEEMLTPTGPAFYVQTRMEIEADVPMPDVEYVEPVQTAA